MKNLKQWINWKSVPDTEPAKKPLKVPFCFKTGKKIDAHDPKNWFTYQEAKNMDANIGFVLTANDPYFCVDLDKCKIDSEWSTHAFKILGWFPGAYVEISYSGDGLHIFGLSRGFPQHASKKKFLDGEVELYTSKRFIAFTEQGSNGNYNVDLTSNLQQFISNVMGTGSKSSQVSFFKADDNRWNNPDPEWIGPEDDNELIKKMLGSNKPPFSVLDETASIHDLWKNNIPVLSKTYPDRYGKGREYDYSDADNGLMSCLAFWTGNHLPRMLKLARMSSLVRRKWDINRDYLKRTGWHSCVNNKKVYRDPKRVSKLQAKNSNDDNYLFGSQIFDISAQVVRFKGCIYILDRHAMFTPNQGVLKESQFNTWYGGGKFTLSHDGKSVTKKPFDVISTSGGYKFPKVSTSCFRPEHKPGEIIKINGADCVNTYIPQVINLSTGNVDMFLFLVNALFPQREDYDSIMSYAAACNQYPGKKFRWCPIIQGVEGNGKSLFMECVGYGIGEKYIHTAQASDLGNKFNSWMAEKLFIMVEEVFTTDKRETIEALKPLITNRRIPSQAKGVDTVTIDNRANFMMTTNHKNAIQKTKRDRRYAIYFTPQQEKEHLERDGLTEAFFKKFTTWLDHESGWDDIAGYLKRYPIIDALNPATTRLTAPDTTSTQEAIEVSQGIVHQEIQEAVAENRHGFRSGWISSYAISELLESKNLVKFFPRRKRREILKEIGYIAAPWMPNGRASKRLPSEDNTQPILYIREDMKFGKVLTVDDYVNSQSEPVPVAVPGVSSAPLPPTPMKDK